MSRACAIVLMACTTVGCRGGFSTTDCADVLDDRPNGTGTGEDPFQICSPAQLTETTKRSENLGAHYIVMRDLDFTDVAFAGIGAVEAPFTGRLDGNGFTIYNLHVTAVAGQPAALINSALLARVDNLALDTITSSGANHVASIIGVCERALVRNASVTKADIRGEGSVGGLVGEASECQVIGATFDGVVEGTGGSIGGIVGAAGHSAFMNVTGTVDVRAPLATEVGGVVGSDNWSPVILQHVTVKGDVVGNEDVGGIVGANSDGSLIYRSRFEGTVRGNTGVGGFAGANYDWPFYVYSTSVEADVVGIDGVGGFSGRHYYRTQFRDSYFRGTLTGVGTGQRAIGGFLGDVEYYGWVERSYVDVTIDSDAATVGGLAGHIGYWSPTVSLYDITRSFSAANVTGSSPTATVSLWVGENLDPNPLVGAGTYYLANGSCTNRGGGGCGTGGMAIPDRTQLETPSGPPLSTWDFTRVWQTQSGALPTLRLEQSSAPTLTDNCSGDAIDRVRYECALSIADDDANEIRIAILDPQHTCTWMRMDEFSLLPGGQIAMLGTPTLSDSCTAAFSITDGTYTSPVYVIPIEIHLGVVLAPADQSGSRQHMGFHMIGSAGATQVFTLTNRETVRVEGLSITGLPSADFNFAGGAYPGTGGTCDTMIYQGQSCTIAITYAPVTAGNVETPITINFTGARGPVSYAFTLAGGGN